MGKSSDQLREEIDAQREDAGAKINQLQHQVQDQVDGTRQQVMDTAEQVKGEAKAMVTDTVDSMKESVENMDIERHVQERPLMSVGAAVLGGFLLGSMLGGDNNSGHQSPAHNYSGGSSASGSNTYSSSNGMGNSLRTAIQKSGLEDTLSNAGAAMVGSVTDQLKEMLDRSFPGFSDKLGNAQQQSGSFTEKARAAQEDAQKA